jgi:hypothetical protein
MNLDAWSVNTTSTGLAELTVRELQDQALLEQTLADAGVPAIVNFGEFCGAADQADNLTRTTGTHFLGGSVTSGGVLLPITINPAAVPSGGEAGYRRRGHRQRPRHSRGRDHQERRIVELSADRTQGHQSGRPGRGKLARAGHHLVAEQRYEK